MQSQSQCLPSDIENNGSKRRYKTKTKELFKIIRHAPVCGHKNRARAEQNPAAIEFPKTAKNKDPATIICKTVETTTKTYDTKSIYSHSKVLCLPGHSTSNALPALVERATHDATV
jgi:hypothetical protein